MTKLSKDEKRIIIASVRRIVDEADHNGWIRGFRAAKTLAAAETAATAPKTPAPDTPPPRKRQTPPAGRRMSGRR